MTHTPCGGPTVVLPGKPAWRFDASTMLDEPFDLSARQQLKLSDSLDVLSREVVDGVLRRHAPCAVWVPATADILVCQAHSQLDLERVRSEATEAVEQAREAAEALVVDAWARGLACAEGVTS